MAPGFSFMKKVKKDGAATSVATNEDASSRGSTTAHRRAKHDIVSVSSARSNKTHGSNDSSSQQAATSNGQPIPIQKKVTKKLIRTGQASDPAYAYSYNSQFNHGYGGPTLLDVAMGESDFPEMDLKEQARLKQQEKNQHQQQQNQHNHHHHHHHHHGGAAGQAGAPGGGAQSNASKKAPPPLDRVEFTITGGNHNVSSNSNMSSVHGNNNSSSNNLGGGAFEGGTSPLGTPHSIDAVHKGMEAMSLQNNGNASHPDREPKGSIPNIVQNVLESVYYDLMDTTQGQAMNPSNEHHFGIALCTAHDGRVYEIGSSDIAFPVQALAKPFVYALALSIYGEDHMRQKVGIRNGDEWIEPGTGRPINPLVRPGAITTTAQIVDVCDGNMDRSEREIIKFLSDLAGKSKKHRLSFNEAVYQEEMERERASTKAALSELAQYGVLTADEDASLELFIRQRAITITCRDLAIMGATLAANGSNPFTKKEACPSEASQLALSVMGNCGMPLYPSQWMHDVGMPAMSTPCGAVVAVAPGRMALAVYSPKLDKFGNPLRGVAACIELSRQLGVHLYLQEPQKQSLTLANQQNMVQSRRWRSPSDRQLLLDHSNELLALMAPSVVDFTFLESSSAKISKACPAFVLLDLSNVQEICPTSETLFEDLVRTVLQSSGTELLLCTNVKKCFLCNPDNHPRVFWPIDHEGMPKYSNIHVHSRDAALEAAENFILGQVKQATTTSSSSSTTMPSPFATVFGEDETGKLLQDVYAKYCATQSFAKGSNVSHSNALYVVESGYFTEWITNEERLAVYGVGTVFGHIPVHGNNDSASTTILSEADEGTCHVLSASAFQQMKQEDPQAAIDLLLFWQQDLQYKLKCVQQQRR